MFSQAPFGLVRTIRKIPMDVQLTSLAGETGMGAERKACSAKSLGRT